jgi:TonB family protein
MVRIITLIGLLLLSQSSFCQGKKQDAGKTKTETSNEKTKPAHFPGGDDALTCYLVKNLDPGVVSVKSLQAGTVYLTFTIEPTGKISDITILKSYSREVNDEIVRVISQMPDWVPSEQLVGYPKGQWVKVSFQYEMSVTIPYINTCAKKKKQKP